VDSFFAPIGRSLHCTASFRALGMNFITDDLSPLSISNWNISLAWTSLLVRKLSFHVPLGTLYVYKPPVQISPRAPFPSPPHSVLGAIPSIGHAPIVNPCSLRKERVVGERDYRLQKSTQLYQGRLGRDIKKKKKRDALAAALFSPRLRNPNPMRDGRVGAL
jgi:hypothetical protein